MKKKEEGMPLQALEDAYRLLPAAMNSREATVLLLAIGLQESRLVHQKQIGGPAHGLLQFEKGGGVRGVLEHPASRDLARKVCQALGVPAEREAVYQALRTGNDALDFAFGRLLLWTHPKPLPKVGEVEAAWQYYLDLWRPGKPHRKTWNGLYAQALETYIESRQPALA